MKLITDGLQTFAEFHTGAVNIVLHVLGFSILGYALYLQDWKLFAISLLVLESGHLYNHRKGITPYDFRVHVLFRRILLFALFCIGIYLLFKTI